MNLDLAVLEERNFDILIGRDILLCALKDCELSAKNKTLTFTISNKNYKVPYENVKSKQTKKEAWITYLVVEKSTLKEKEKVLRNFEGYPVHKKYNFFYGDLPYCYPKFHSSTLPYRSMSLKKLKQLPIAEQSYPNSICLLWASGPKLLVTIQLMSAWGFDFRTILLVWSK